MKSSSVLGRLISPLVWSDVVANVAPKYSSRLIRLDPICISSPFANSPNDLILPFSCGRRFSRRFFSAFAAQTSGSSSGFDDDEVNAVKAQPLALEKVTILKVTDADDDDDDDDDDLLIRQGCATFRIRTMLPQGF